MKTTRSPRPSNALKNTLGREPINLRPRAHTEIFRENQQDSFGFITYSEGCNDDVNKVVWSCLGWNPDQTAEQIMQEYSRYFIGTEYKENFAEGLFALEQN